MPAMNAYPDFDAYLSDQSARNLPVLRALRKFVAAKAPELTEAVKWGNGCWVKGPKEPIAYVYSDTDHVQFGFIRGASLDDPKGLLEGKGQYVRHVKVKKPADIDRAAFTALLAQAVELGGPPRARKKATKKKAAKTRRKA